MKIAFEAGELHVVTEGDPTLPPLFILPGGPGLSFTRYKASCDPLSTQAYLIYLDPPGCGESSLYAKESMDMAQYVRAITTVATELKLDKFSLLGFSYGSMIAMKYMSELPERLDTAILIGGAPDYSFLEKAKENLHKKGSEAQITISQHLWAGDFASEAQAQEFFITMASLYSVTSAQAAPSQAPQLPPKINIDALNEAFAKEFWQFDLRPQLPKTTCPVLALTGDQDWVNDPSYLQVLKCLPDQTQTCAVAVPNCGHLVNKDQPAFFYDSVSCWLRNTTSEPKKASDACKEVTRLASTL